MSAPRTKTTKSTIATVLRRIGLVLLGIVLYAVCINMFSGFPFGSAVSWIAIGALSVFAAIVWLVDERRSRAADDDAGADDVEE